MLINEGEVYFKEVLLSNNEHSSARIPWKHWQKRKGVVLKTIDLPLLPKSKEDIVARFREAITEKKRAISLVHVTNTNGLRISLAIFNTKEDVDYLVGALKAV